MRRTRLYLLVFAVVALLLAGACGGDDDDNASPTAGAGSDTTAVGGEPAVKPGTLRLGYFPNVTHAPAVVGVENEIFAKALGTEVKLETKTFNAGPAAVEALLGGAIDATYIGPNPAINAFSKSNGEAIRIIAGSTSGGAALVVKPAITKAADLKGKKVATPQLGNTQDVALRAWLDEQGLKTDPQGGGDVSIVPQENSQTLDTFKAGQIDGAWVPEPWVSRLVQEGGGKVLVDEKTLWPGGRFVTTHLIVRTKFLEENPGAVYRLLKGHVEAVSFTNDNATEAQTITNTGIEKVTGKKLGDAVIQAAWKNLAFTENPIASSLKKSAANAEKAGLLEPVDLTGIYDLELLNQVLRAAGAEEVKAA